MAIRCSCPSIIIQGGPAKKPLHKVFMLHNSQLPTNKPPKLLIKSSIDNKIFEDQSKGIVCYKNESGEIICEGYDEGPRFHHHVPRKDSPQKELQTIDVHRQSCPGIVESDGFREDDQMGVSVLRNLIGMALKDIVN